MIIASHWNILIDKEVGKTQWGILKYRAEKDKTVLYMIYRQ